MELELKDPDILKCNTLQVLASYPNGIKFGDFIGTFYQIHHFHPQFSHYGYSSLRNLLDDMWETVVVEVSQSNGSIMKLVNGLNLGGWLAEIEQNGPGSFEEEGSKLKEEEGTRGEDTAAADLAEVLAAITNLLIEYESGLQFEKMQALLFSTIGIDLQTFSVTKGYKDVLTFLSDQIPNIIIKRRGTLKRYVIQLSKDLTVASVPICKILKLYPDGLKLSKLKEAVKKKCGYDLDVFCYQIGFSNIVSCLQEIPELIINRNKNKNCKVQLKSVTFSSSSSRSSHSTYDSKPSPCKSKNINQDASKKKPASLSCSSYRSSYFSSSDSDQSTSTSNSSNQDPVLSKVMASLTALLNRYSSGLRVKKLQELLLAQEGIDLKMFSFALGHKDTVEFLQQKMPQLILKHKKNKIDTVVIQPYSDSDGNFTHLLNAPVPLLESTGTADPPNSTPDVPIPFLKSIGTADPLNSAPASLSCSSYRSSYFSSSDSDQPTSTSNSSNQDPVLSKVMASLTALLNRYSLGLRVKKLQELLLAQEGIDLKMFSFALGHKDTVEFLQQKMPQLILKHKKNKIDTVVIQPYSVPLLESTGTADPPNSTPDVPIPFLKSIGTADPLNSAPASFRCSSSSDSDQSTCTSNNSNQDESEKRSVLSDIMALVTAILINYKEGLRIWKLQYFLLTDEGIDLGKFSISQGYKDTLEFLEQKMPQLTLNYQSDRLDTVVIEPHAEDISKPASAVSDLSASDSQCQNIPASIPVVPPEVNNLFHTNQSGPSTMSSHLPSFHEPHNTLSVKAKSSSLFASVVRSQQQPNPCQLSAKSVTEQISGNSHQTTVQPSTVPDELKQQVARILARHPKGMSLFQFRISYSATFKQHFPVGNAASTKQRLLEMADTVYLKGHGVQALLMPVSPVVPPAKRGQSASSKVENSAVVSSLPLVHPVPMTKSPVKTFGFHSVLSSPEKTGSKDCCISKDLSPTMLLAPCQEQEKVRTSLPGFSDQLSKVEVIPQSFLAPAAPRAVIMPIPKPRHSFLQYYQCIRALENNGDKPFTGLHTQSIPGSIKIMQSNTSHLNGPGPTLGEIPFIPHCSAALPTHSEGTVCSENLQPGVLKSRFTSSTNSRISVPSVDSTPVPPVLVKPPEIYSPRRTSQSSDNIQPMLPVEPLPPIPSVEQRNYNRSIAVFDSLSEAQIQSRAPQRFSSPDSSAMTSNSSLPRNSASVFPSRSHLNYQLQQPAHARLDDLQSISVSLADQRVRKASLERASPATMYQRKPTYANSLEASSTTESFITCSVRGSLHASSVIVNNSTASPSVSSRTRAVSPPSSPVDFTANSYDQIVYASAKITSNSSPLFSEMQVSAQQREYVRAAATAISSTKTTSTTSLSLESTTKHSHHQFAYASSRISTNSSAVSSETYDFTPQNTQASETGIASSAKMASSISSLLDSSTSSLTCQDAHASAKATSTSSVSSKSTAYHTPNADFKTSLNHDPPSQNNLTPSSSKQGDQSAPLPKKQVPVNPVSRFYDGCLLL